MNMKLRVTSITNSVIVAAYGLLGYEWSPNTLEIEAGDTVVFGWSFPSSVSATIGLQTGADASSTTYDGVGTQAGPSSSGSSLF